MGRPRIPSEKRFWAKVIKRGPDECWTWTASRMGLRGEYGQFSYEGKRMGAHQASWILHNGPIPEGLEVCHSCDNGLCVNPAHLWLGTHYQNMHDKLDKKRNNNAKGSRNGFAKLSEADVIEIRRLKSQGMSSYDIARKYHVTQPCISYVISKGWKHVPQQV